jgi:hypothetical protein
MIPHRIGTAADGNLKRLIKTPPKIKEIPDQRSLPWNR